MASTATDLLRSVARAFYSAGHVLVIEALIHHSTLSESDLAHILNLQPKYLRKLCTRLIDDRLVSIQTRFERRTDGTSNFRGGSDGIEHRSGKEPLTSKHWYYLNFHCSIDSVKWRMHKLYQKIEADSAPTTEKKDLDCSRCKTQWTFMEVIHQQDFTTGLFPCPRCSHILNDIQEDAKAHANEGLKRLNCQLEGVVRALQRVDGDEVPENDFESALARQKPIVRASADPGQMRTEVVDLPKHGLQSTKGLDAKPEKLTVFLQNDQDVKRAEVEAEALARREKQARQNMLPDWIARSTVSGDTTAVGAMEDRERLVREAYQGELAEEKDEVGNPAAISGEQEMLAAYWAEMQNAQEEAAGMEVQEDEEDEEDYEFENVDGISAPSAFSDTVSLHVEASGSGGKKRPAEDGSTTLAVGEGDIGPKDGRDAKKPRQHVDNPSAAA